MDKFHNKGYKLIAAAQRIDELQLTLDKCLARNINTMNDLNDMMTDSLSSYYNIIRNLKDKEKKLSHVSIDSVEN